MGERGKYREFDGARALEFLLGEEEALIKQPRGERILPTCWQLDGLLAELGNDPRLRSNQIKLGRLLSEAGWRWERMKMSGIQRKVYYPPIYETRYEHQRIVEQAPGGRGARARDED